MADPKVRFKRSSVPGKIPNETQVPLGEIALNTYDGKVFASKNVGIGTTVFVVNPWNVGAGTDSYNIDFTVGNVGIGTTNPTTKLQVVGNVNISGIATANFYYGDGSNLTGITATAAPGGTDGQIQYNNNNSTGGASEFYYDDINNRVGIGTSVPQYTLDVNGDINFNGSLNQNGSTFVASRWTSGTGDDIYRLNGNVGVGTTNPTTKLEIGGILGFGAGNNVRIGDNTTGANVTSGTNNIFIGVNAGNSIANGQYNVFFGYYAGRLTTSSNNVFVGRGSGYSNTSGELNVFLGLYAGNYNTTGIKNTFLGPQAGTYNSSGSDNVFLGSYTGISPSASRKVVLGSGYDLSNLFDAPDTTKDLQFAVGVRTDANPSKYWLVGNENFNVGVGITNPTTKLEIDGVLGFGAGNSVRIGDNTTGANVPSSFGYVNIFIGASAGSSETAPNRCTYIGYEAGKNAINGASSTFVGAGAGKNTTNIRNNFFGNYAGGYNTSGEQNTFIGGYAGGNNTIGSFNTFLGSYTGIATSSSRKILIGSGDGNSFALFDAPDTTKDIQFAVGIRTDANPANYWLVGNENFNIGIGITNPTTKLEIDGVLGFGAGNNVRIGDVGTGSSLTSGVNNVFIGSNAGKFTTDGTSNVFIGPAAGYYSTGIRNNFFGIFSGYYNTTGSGNNFFGYNAGAYNTTGQSNIFLGHYSGSQQSTTASHKVIFGSGISNANTFDAPDTTKDTQFAVGVRTDANPANYWLVGNENFNVGIGTTNPTTKLTVGGDANVTGVITATTFTSSVATGTSPFTVSSTTLVSNLNADLLDGNDSTYYTNASNLSSGTINKDRLSTSNSFTVLGNLYVDGNISFGGTTTQLNTTEITFSDPDIVLGVGTTSTFNPSDNTANHGGIAIASTEGTPLVNLNLIPAEINPSTYKKIMWFKGDTIGVGLTDAWLFNYGVGIGSTQVPNGVRLAAGAVQFTENDLSAVRNVNASGIVTATTFSGSEINLTGVATASSFSGSGTNLTGIVTSIVAGTNITVSGSTGQVTINSTGGGESYWVSTVAGIHTLSNVGIGTTNPTSKLHISGGDVTLGTGVTITGQTANSFTVNSSRSILNGDTIISNTLPTTVSYASSFRVQSQETEPREVAFSNDGKTMYVLGNAGDDITWYSLSTPWNITTATHVSQFSVASRLTTPRGFYFKPDGTKFYVVGTVGAGATEVNQYTCSTPWDLTTASYDSVAFSLISEDSAPQAIQFKPDGTKFYIAGTTNDTIYQYSCSTPWNVSTASYDSVSFNVGGQEGFPEGIQFSHDGTKLLLTGSTDDEVNYYTLSTPWDISTTSFVGIITSSSVIGESAPTGLYWKPDGTKFYVCGSGNDSVYEFNMTSDADLKVTGTLDVYGNADVYENLNVYGDSKFYNKVGIGTTNPTSKLHVVGDTLVTGVSTATAFNGDINAGVGTITTASITTINNATTFNAIPAFNGGTTGASAPFTVDSTFKVTNLNADLLDDLDSTQFLRSDVADTLTVTTTDPNVTQNALLLDYNLSGTTLLTADRNKLGLYLDLDHSSTGGTNTVGQRETLLGIWSDIDSSGSPFFIYSVRGDTRVSTSSTTVATQYGGFFIAEADPGVGGTVTTSFGVQAQANHGGTGDATSLYGGYFVAYKETAATSTLANAIGSRSTVVIDGNTITNSYAAQHIIDVNGGTLTNAYVTYGAYEGSVPAGGWNAYYPSDAPSYFLGEIRIGSTTDLGNQKLQVTGDAIITGQLQSTDPWDGTTGAGQIYLNGATGNRIDFNTNGVAAPAFATRSAGTKLVLYPQVGAATVDYGFGIEGGTLWSSVPTTGQQFKWYGGTTLAATLTGAGALTLVGGLSATTLTSTVATGTAPLTVSSTTLVTNLNADLLDGINSSSFARVDASSTFTVATYFQSNLGTTSGSLSNPPLQAFATGTNAAFMSFHRSGSYAVNFGLDSDNVLRIGGWSASANRWQLDMSGNGTYAGTVTANSDIKLKENIEVIPNALEKVSQIRGVTFTRNDQDDKKKRHAGVIAQEVEKVLPEVVMEGSDGIKSVAYGNLTSLLIEAIKEQQKQINELKEEINILKNFSTDK